MIPFARPEFASRSDFGMTVTHILDHPGFVPENRGGDDWYISATQPMITPVPLCGDVTDQGQIIRSWNVNPHRLCQQCRDQHLRLTSTWYPTDVDLVHAVMAARFRECPMSQRAALTNQVMALSVEIVRSTLHDVVIQLRLAFVPTVVIWSVLGNAIWGSVPDDATLQQHAEPPMVFTEPFATVLRREIPGLS